MKLKSCGSQTHQGNGEAVADHAGKAADREELSRAQQQRRQPEPQGECPNLRWYSTSASPLSQLLLRCSADMHMTDTPLTADRATSTFCDKCVTE